MKVLIVIPFFVVSLDVLDSARILCVFSVPFHSHQKVLRILPQELARRGHQIVILTPEPGKEDLENVTEINVGEFANAHFDTNLKEMSKGFTSFALTPLQFITTAYKVNYPTADMQFSHVKVKELLENKTEHFDLILVEDCVRSVITIGARFNTPIVLVSSFISLPETFNHVGSETNPLLFPYLQKIPHTFWERLTTFVEFIRISRFMSTLAIKDDKLILKHFGKGLPSIEEVRKNVKMAMSVVNHMWDGRRAVTPAVTFMGAVHLKKPKPLPQDLTNFLDNSKQGVIYMSLGSKIQSSDLPPQVLEVILKVFASLPYDVLWKWNNAHLPYIPSNVHLENWVPQADLLYHPSIKAFITQGGLQSSDEAIAAGVPLVGLSVFADQHQNVQRYKDYGIGESLDIDSLNEEEFRKTIVNVVEDKQYLDNIRRLSRIMSDQRTDGVKLALHRIQRLLEHGVPFPPAAADVTSADYFMLDVFVPLFFGNILLLVIVLITINWFAKNSSQLL